MFKKIFLLILTFFILIFVYFYIRAFNFYSLVQNHIFHSSKIEWMTDTEKGEDSGFINDYPILKLELAYTAMGAILLTYCSTDLCGYDALSGKQAYKIPLEAKESVHISAETDETMFFIRTPTKMSGHDGLTGSIIWEIDYTDEALGNYFSIFNTDTMQLISPFLVTLRNDPNTAKGSNFKAILEAFNSLTGKHLWTTTIDTHAFGGVHFKRFDGNIVVGTDSGNTFVYDIETGSLKYTIPIDSQAVYPDSKVGESIIARVGVNALDGIVIFNALDGKIQWSKMFVKGDYREIIRNVCVNSDQIISVLTSTPTEESFIYRLNINDGTEIFKTQLPKDSANLECSGENSMVISSRFVAKDHESVSLYTVGQVGDIKDTKEFKEPISRYSVYGDHMYLVSQNSLVYDYNLETYKLNSIFGLQGKYSTNPGWGSFISYFPTFGKPVSLNDRIYIKGQDGFLYAVKP